MHPASGTTFHSTHRQTTGQFRKHPSRPLHRMYPLSTGLCLCSWPEEAGSSTQTLHYFPPWPQSARRCCQTGHPSCRAPPPRSTSPTTGIESESMRERPPRRARSVNVAYRSTPSQIFQNMWRFCAPLESTCGFMHVDASLHRVSPPPRVLCPKIELQVSCLDRYRISVTSVSAFPVFPAI